MEKHYQEFLNYIPPERIIFGKTLEEKSYFGADRSIKTKPEPCMVILPKSTEEVQKIIQYCFANNLSVVPSGGRTGYSGGASASNKEIILSMEKMNSVLSFDQVFGSITVQAGMITENINEFLKDKELFFPIQFAATGSSHIGGNLSTNAGGHRVIRYGTTRQWVLGLKIVDGMGNILALGGNIIKDATGYDLKHLVIGAEGTLGIVTEITLKLTQKPGNSNVFLFAISSYESLLKLFLESQRLPLKILAFEFFTANCMEKVLEDSMDLKNPFPQMYPYYVLLELENNFQNICDKKSIDKILDDFLEKLVMEEMVKDGILAQNSTQEKTLWKYREHISEALSLRHTVHKNDISIPMANIQSFVEDLENIFHTHYRDYEIAIFGHIGDGNLHINTIKPEKTSLEEFTQKTKDTDNILFQLVQKQGGSISAEHGIGVLKKEFLHYSRSAREMEIMKGIKKLFDPKNIINPGKLLDIYTE